MFSAFAAGFGLGTGLIAAIGAQNAFVLRQGLRREHVLLVAAVCTLCDWALISLGAAGFGTLVARVPPLSAAAAWGGAAFLAFYGARAFLSAMRPAVLHAEDTAPVDKPAASAVALAALAVSLLNPHVYLDTVVLLGGIAGQYEAAARPVFAAGAGLASLAWFFSVAFGARLLAPLFERPAAWRVLDAFVGVVMWWIAAGLVWGRLAG